MVELICTTCPKGCHLTVDENNPGHVEGQGCKRGVDYAKNEILHPVRMVTSTVRVEGAAHSVCPVKTSSAIPKPLMQKCVRALDGVRLTAPVHMGQIIVKDVCGSGVDIIATRDLPTTNTVAAKAVS